MSALKISVLEDDTPVKVTLDLPAGVHRDLVDYGKAISAANSGKAVEPGKLIPEMLRRFMASDRGFVRGRKRGGPA
ncbi:DUF2274 domain-containing protein [Caulobacter sp. CCNWLY153]|uniref:DUF2274 domain-containing protein n=1 Tax=unclassified Caulobacter TaxID=2648921 RepID=UPI002FF352DB